MKKEKTIGFKGDSNAIQQLVEKLNLNNLSEAIRISLFYLNTKVDKMNDLEKYSLLKEFRNEEY